MIYKRMRLLIMLLICTTPAQADALADEVRVAVAANFTRTMQALIPMFERQSGYRVRASFASTGKLYAQIANGAPFDLLLAADSARPERAEEASLAVAGSRFTYAVGRLCLWSREVAQWHDAEAWLKAMQWQRIAIANPKTAPYGAAAVQALHHIAALPADESRLVRGESVAQAFQFAATSSVAAGFIACSQLSRSAGGTQWQVPQLYYDPIAQQAVLLSRSRHHAAALAFIDFLKSKRARDLIASHGYGVAE